MVKAELAQFKEERASQEAAFENSEEAFTNFSYYNALADAIQVVRRADANADISIMADEVVQYATFPSLVLISLSSLTKSRFFILQGRRMGRLWSRTWRSSGSKPQ